MLNQNKLLRRLSLGSFETMLQQLTKDPAMLLWLSGTDNTKWSPNENYARELMELFTLGAGRGYTERDVREQARLQRGRDARHRLRASEDEQHPVIGPDVEGPAGCVAIDPGEGSDRRPGNEAPPREGIEGRREGDRHPGRHACHRRGRPAGDHVPLPQEARNATGPRGGDQREGEVPAGREDGRWTEPAEEAPRLRHRCRQAQRVEDEVQIGSRAAQRTDHQLVVGQLAIGHQAALETARAADVADLKPGLRVAQCPCDGQRGVDVPACPAARHRTPHQALILSAWSRGRSTRGCRPPRG